MGYWFLFIAVVMPLLTFSATPESSRWWRMGRSVLSFGLGYGVTLVILYIACVYYEAVEDRSVGAWFLWGFFFTLGYMSIWEYRWRRKYRASLISIRKGLGDDWINGKVLVVGCFGIFLFLLLVFALIMTALQMNGIISK